VQQATFAAVHRGKSIGDAGLANLFRSGLGGHPQFLRAQRFEVAGIETHQVVLALIEAKHLCGKGLKRLQQLAIVLRHERNIEPT
jgi:hypothetical protein